MQVKSTKTGLDALRRFYEIETLLARHGTADEGKIPPKRPHTDYLRAALHRLANETCAQINAAAERAAMIAQQAAREGGHDVDTAAAVARETVWQEITGCRDAFSFMVSIGANRNFAD